MADVAGVDPRIANALHTASKILADAGAIIVRVELPSTRAAVDAFPTLVSSEDSAEFESLRKKMVREQIQSRGEFFTMG